MNLTINWIILMLGTAGWIIGLIINNWTVYWVSIALLVLNGVISAITIFNNHKAIRGYKEKI